MNVKYYIADTETCGFKPPPQPASGIVGIAWSEIDPSTLELKDVQSQLTDPKWPIENSASVVHGIYDKDVVGRPEVSEVFGFVDPVVIIGHNVDFDLRFLDPYIENLHGKLCTLALARVYIRDSLNHKLQTLADHLGLEKGAAHDAGGDVHTTVGLLKWLVNVSGRSLPQLVEAARKPMVIHNMPFGKHKGTPLVDLPLSYIRWFLDQEIDASLRKSFEDQIKLRG